MGELNNIKTILVADDEAIVRESIRDWLIDAGYQVVTATTGEEALKLVGERDFGVVILDIRLPGMTGVKVLKQIKAVKPDIRTVIITAYPTSEFQEEAESIGVVDFLIKPIAPDNLERLIKETLCGIQTA